MVLTEADAYGCSWLVILFNTMNILPFPISVTIYDSQCQCTSLDIVAERRPRK